LAYAIQAFAQDPDRAIYLDGTDDPRGQREARIGGARFIAATDSEALESIANQMQYAERSGLTVKGIPEDRY